MGEGRERGLPGFLPDTHNPKQSPSSCPEAGLTLALLTWTVWRSLGVTGGVAGSWALSSQAL